eukprot:736519-Rhodomonas_salina.1
MGGCDHPKSNTKNEGNIGRFAGVILKSFHRCKSSQNLLRIAPGGTKTSSTTEISVLGIPKTNRWALPVNQSTTTTTSHGGRADKSDWICQPRNP